MRKFLVIFYFLICLVQIGKAQPYNVYRVLEGDREDSTYYHWVGPVYLLDLKDSNGNSIPYDGIGPRWERRPKAPDGFYLTYYPTDKYNYTYKKTKPGDTVCFDEIAYTNGKPEGYYSSYYYKEKLLLSEGYYKNGFLESQTIYNYFPAPYFLPISGYGGGYHNSYSYLYKPGEFLKYMHRYDEPNKRTYSKCEISDGTTTRLIYEENVSPDNKNIHVVQHYLNGSHSLAVELTVKDTELSLKRWCEDGVLYYHLVETIQHNTQGTWTVTKTSTPTNLLVGEERRWGSWQYYCWEKKGR